MLLKAIFNWAIRSFYLFLLLSNLLVASAHADDTSRPAAYTPLVGGTYYVEDEYLHLCSVKVVNDELSGNLTTTYIHDSVHKIPTNDLGLSVTFEKIKNYDEFIKIYRNAKYGKDGKRGLGRAIDNLLDNLAQVPGSENIDYVLSKEAYGLYIKVPLNSRDTNACIMATRGVFSTFYISCINPPRGVEVGVVKYIDYLQPLFPRW